LHSVQGKLYRRLQSATVMGTTHKTVMSTVLSRGCETRSLALREERRLRGFGRGLLRGTPVPKGKEATGGCTRLHNEGLHNLYSFPNVGKAS
jgi:hypothetical protein